MTTTSKTTPWIKTSPFVPGAGLRLFCFPYAGGGASVFRQWPSFLPQWVEVCPVQYPGRENRISEPLISSLDELVAQATQALAPYFDRPFVFYGHSIGARIAFEMAREIRRTWGLGPAALIVSGSRAPQIPEPRPLHHLPNDAFVSELRRFSGTPEAVLQNREIMEMFLPILRADFTVDETYAFSEGEPLNCPIHAFGGTDDEEALVDELEAWAGHTAADFTLEMIQGDHFFLQTEMEHLLHSVSQILELNRREAVAVSVSL